MSKYIRKTRDEYEVWTNYGYGWEVEVTESTLEEAKKCKRDYIENARGLIDIRIKKHRVKINKEEK